MPIAEPIVHAVRHQKLRVLRPAVEKLGQPRFVFAERVAVSGRGILFMRRAVTDDAVDDDDGRPIVGAAERLQRARERGGVVGVAQPRHVPAIAAEPAFDVLAESKVGMALDGDRVAVVDPAQIGEVEMAGERGRLAGDAFHEVAVAADRVNVEVEYRKMRPVVARAEPARGDRHADAVAAALAERPGRGFHPGGAAVFRVAGRHAVELAKVLDVVEAHRGGVGDAAAVASAHAGEVKQRIKQHRSVAA